VSSAPGWPDATVPRPSGPSVWHGRAVGADRGSWTLDLADADIAARIDDRLRRGRGFAVVSGFPVDDRTAACERFAALSARMGTLLPQNTAGDRLHLVQTRGGGADRTYGSRGSGELLFHTDQAAAPAALRPRVFALLCLERAARGGHTQLASGHALVRELLDAGPDPGRAAALRQAVPFARDPDGVSDEPPVVAPTVEPADDGRAALRFNRYFVEVGARTTATGIPAQVTEALDAADEALGRGHLVHQLLLEPGQALFVDNLTVLHNRTAYEDGDGHRRCLARTWVR
jgi:alpha-ketoglutarate-dependent taurine dioxygenase